MISQPHAHITASLILDNVEYEVQNFRIDFVQSTDYKGQPQHEVKGGQISLIIPQAADNNLYNWAKQSTMLKDGKVVFQTDMGMTVLAVEFTNTYCVSLYRSINATSGTNTSLILSPEIVSMNGVTHDNRWV